MLNMSQLPDRLTDVMQELSLTSRTELASYCGVSEGLVTQWFSGQTKLGPKPLKAFAKTKFNIEWIADGTLPKYRPGSENEPIQPADKAEDAKTSAPKIALIYATEREIALLTAFRECTDRGQRLIEKSSNSAERDKERIKELRAIFGA